MRGLTRPGTSKNENSEYKFIKKNKLESTLEKDQDLKIMILTYATNFNISLNSSLDISWFVFFSRHSSSRSPFIGRTAVIPFFSRLVLFFQQIGESLKLWTFISRFM